MSIFTKALEELGFNGTRLHNEDGSIQEVTAREQQVAFIENLYLSQCLTKEKLMKCAECLNKSSNLKDKILVAAHLRYICEKAETIKDGKVYFDAELVLDELF